MMNRAAVETKRRIVEEHMGDAKIRLERARRRRDRLDAELAAAGPHAFAMGHERILVASDLLDAEAVAQEWGVE